jgi:hypothetical protein
MHSLKVCEVYQKARVMKGKNQLSETHNLPGVAMKRLGGSSVVIVKVIVHVGAQRDLKRSSFYDVVSCLIRQH